jgi:ethanolamine permease
LVFVLEGTSAMKSAKSTDLSKSESALESIESSSIAEAFDAVLPSKYYANQYHLIAFALLGSLSNIYSVWNVAVGSGLGVQIICSIVFGICYLFFYFCVSELTSTFPFAGGSYALARCTLGFFPGYLVGCLEALLYIMCLGLFNAAIANNITVSYPEYESALVIFVVIIYVLQFILCSSKRLLWWSVSAIAACAFVINFAYVCGALRYVHFQRNAYSTVPTADDNLFFPGVHDDYGSAMAATAASTGVKSLIVGSGLKIFRTIPASVGYFSGPEFVNFACDDVLQPRKQVPVAQITGATIMLLFNIIVPILACSMGTGAMGSANQLNPLLPSLAQVFGISRAQALMLELPALFGYCVCLCYALSKLICALAESHLFPHYFARRREATDVPMRAMALGLVLALLSILLPAFVNIMWLLQWPNIIAILVLLVDSTQLIGYVVLRFKLSSFPRQFVSPFGVYGAAIAFTAFLLSLIASIGFRENSSISDGVIAIFLITVTAIYYCVAKYFQEFSAVEKAVMVPVHTEILTANRKSISFILSYCCLNYVD